MRYVVNYKIKDGADRCVVWDAKKPLTLGYPARFLLDIDGGQLACHSLGEKKIPSKIMPLAPEVKFGDLNVRFKKIVPMPKMDPKLVATATVPNIAWLDDSNVDHDYKNFKKLTKRTYSGGLAFLLALWLFPMIKLWLVGPGTVASPTISLTIAHKGGAAPGEKAAPPPPASYAKAQSKGQQIKKAQEQARAAATPEAQQKTLRNTFASLFKSGFGMANPSARKPASTGGAAGGTQLAALGSETFEGGREGGVPGGQAGGVLGGVGHTVGVTGGGGQGGYGGATSGIGVGGQGEGFLSMNLKDALVEEGLTKDEVGKVIHSKISEIRYCYESSMVYKPEIEGKLVVDFTIAGNGMVKVSKVKESSVEDPRLDDCILRRLAKWQFPKPKAGVDVAVTYPFIFKKLRR